MNKKEHRQDATRVEGILFLIYPPRQFIIAEKDIPEQELKNVVAKAGYDAVSVSSEPYEKKGLFFAFRGVKPCRYRFFVVL